MWDMIQLPVRLNSLGMASAMYRHAIPSESIVDDVAPPRTGAAVSCTVGIKVGINGNGFTIEHNIAASVTHNVRFGAVANI